MVFFSPEINRLRPPNSAAGFAAEFAVERFAVTMRMKSVPTSGT